MINIEEIKEKLLSSDKLNQKYIKIFEKEGYFHEFKFGKIPCRMIRNRFGCWAGYCALSSNHQDYNKEDEFYNMYCVHGGITFTGTNEVLNSEFKNYYWIGFDTAHYNDLMPLMILGCFSDNTFYRDFNYVKNQVEKLAEQIYKRSLSFKIKRILEKLN